jgi:uncharacterized protein YecE (DUF72 family)
MAAGRIVVGVGGWTYKPWRGTFYPQGLPQRQELEFASRALTSIEINGTFYSTFKPASWQAWREATPDGFVFAMKGSRFCVTRKQLAGAGPAVARYVGQGLSALGDRLGPINWQFQPTRAFDEADVDAFLGLLPREVDGLPLRHAIEARHPSFQDERFFALTRRHGVAVVYADHETHPCLDAVTADFSYARLTRTAEDVETGYTPDAIRRWAGWARERARHGDVFVYFIAGAKVRAPEAAQALIAALG